MFVVWYCVSGVWVTRRFHHDESLHALLFVASVRRSGLRPRPDDARAIAVRVERAGLSAVWRKRLHRPTGARPVWRRHHRACLSAATRARSRRRDRCQPDLRHLASVPVLLALHSPRHLRRRVHPAAGHRRLPYLATGQKNWFFTACVSAALLFPPRKTSSSVASFPSSSLSAVGSC